MGHTLPLVQHWCILLDTCHAAANPRSFSALQDIAGLTTLLDGGISHRVISCHAIRFLVFSWSCAGSNLSQVVAVIPVIGKSDSMTVGEMVEFKTKIVQEARNASGLEFFQFSGGW